MGFRGWYRVIGAVQHTCPHRTEPCTHVTRAHALCFGSPPIVIYINLLVDIYAHDSFSELLYPALNMPVFPCHFSSVVNKSKHVDTSIDVPISLRPTAVDAIHAQAKVGIYASPAVLIFLVYKLCGPFAAARLGCNEVILCFCDASSSASSSYECCLLARERLLRRSMPDLGGYNGLSAIRSSASAPRCRRLRSQASSRRSLRRVCCLLLAQANAVPLDHRSVDRDVVHDEISPVRKSRTGAQVEISGSVHEPAVQCQDAFSAAGNACEAFSASPRPFSMQTDETGVSRISPL